jgi:hypothetical protein
MGHPQDQVGLLEGEFVLGVCAGRSKRLPYGGKGNSNGCLLVNGAEEVGQEAVAGGFDAGVMFDEA